MIIRKQGWFELELYTPTPDKSTVYLTVNIKNELLNSTLDHEDHEKSKIERIDKMEGAVWNQTYIKLKLSKQPHITSTSIVLKM